jgi:hypothetical protein
MIFRAQGKQPATLIRIGLVFQVLAGLSHWYFQRAVNVSENITDLATGFFQGVSIGCLLLGIWLSSRRPRITNSRLRK